jgi:hypothetical protein
MAASNRPVRRRSTEIAPRRPQPLAHRPKPRPHQPSVAAARDRGRTQAGGLVALPWPVRTLLLAGLLGLAALAILLGGGTLARVTGGLGGALGNAFGGLFPSAAPAASASAPDIPTPQLDRPLSAYTQLPSIDISGHLPGDVAGTSDMLHVYVGGTLHAQQQVPTTNDFTVSAVPLAEGPNVITATLVTADGESGPSAPITINFDDVPPPLTLTSPKDGAAVTTATVAVKGTTQPGATVTVHDANTGGIPSVTANAAGAFGVNVTLAQGPNVLTITAADPAGNRTTKTLTVTHGSGALKAKLTLSWSTMSNKNVASSPLRITVLVNDATGKPITVGATATFTVSPPGQPAIVSGDPPVTLSHGTGSWTVTLAPVDAGHVALPQDGFVTVTVTLADGRTITARGSFTITK